MTKDSVEKTKPRVFFAFSISDIKTVEKMAKELSRYFEVVTSSIANTKTDNLENSFADAKAQISKSDYVLGYFSGKESLPMMVANEVALGQALGKEVIIVSPKSVRKKMKPFFSRLSGKSYDSPQSLIKSMEVPNRLEQ